MTLLLIIAAFLVGGVVGILFGARNVKVTKALDDRYKSAVDAAKDKTGI